MSIGNDDPLSQAESLDEDNMRVDPLEAGMDPPERWSEADRHGMTLAEQREGEPMGDRLAEEEPDVNAEIAPPGPETPIDQLDDRIDEQSDIDRVAAPEVDDPVLADAAARGQSADEAGGSVAESIREGQEADPTV
ncbi:MAG: hypothetical protein M3443_12135 [Actinomycetota bacterium]|nr:hypothetical protein [Actinomycetota bacterium]